MNINSCLKEITGLVFNIQRYSIHDGPGLRTIIFLKGCPLKCKWCSNPESQSLSPVILFDHRKCIQCNACVQTCTREAITIVGDDRRVDPEKCNLCFNCLDICYSGALELVGKKMSVEEVLEEVRKDLPFYTQSNGGITLSGGEPAVQHDFSVAILDECKKEGIHTALETCGFAHWSVLRELVNRVDLVLYDIKHVNPEIHKKLTGQTNTLILQNAKLIADLGKKMIVRVPVIPTCNSTEESIREIMNFVLSLKSVKEIHLLPYHRYGKNKYDRLGWEYTLGEIPSPKDDEMNKLKVMGKELGLIVQIGG